MSGDEIEPTAPQAGTPTWVKVFGAVAIAIAAVVLIVLVGGGEHGPGRHSSWSTSDGPAAASAAAR